MQFAEIPERLRDRLGDEASVGLLDLLSSAESRWRNQVLNTASERFDLRLAEELALVRREMYEGLGSVRREMYDGFTSLRQEIATNRVELLKWSFLFWVGQLASIAGLLALVSHGTGR